MNQADYKGKLFLVYGPSGSGKTSLVTAAIQKIARHASVSQVITYTCRAPRPFEVHGKDYHFITQEEFAAKQETGFFIDTNDYLNKQYGCPCSLIDDLRDGKNLIVILDRNGTKNMSQMIKNAILIWLTVPLNELEKRLLQRNSEDSEQLLKRLKQAKKEIVDEEMQKMHHYCIINDDFELSVQQMTFLMENELGNLPAQNNPETHRLMVNTHD